MHACHDVAQQAHLGLYGALSNVPDTVTDTKTGAKKTYTTLLALLASVAGTSAF